MHTKFLHIILCLLSASSLLAENRISSTCERWRRTMNYPHYYCYCTEESEVFTFPQERTVNDTMWFTANLSDLKQGLTTYWFSENAVSIEVYAFCNSKQPTFSITVGGNRMAENSVDEINEKLQEFGDLSDIIGTLVTPHIRIYPKDKGSGQVYCYPYNQGPHSTCDAPLPIHASMTYVSSHENDVYALLPADMPKSGKMIVHWKEETNQPCSLEISTICDGAPLYSATLSDSLHFYWIDSTLLTNQRANNAPLYFRFTHDIAHVGRIRFIPNPEHIILLTDSIICQGKSGYSPNDTITTMEEEDIWLAPSSIASYGYRLITLTPDTIYDSISVDREQIEQEGYYYAAADTTLYTLGDHILVYEQVDQCTEVYALHLTEVPTITTLLQTNHNTSIRLQYRQDIGIYIRREGKVYNLLGKVIG